MGNPRRGPSRKRDINSTGRSGSRRRRGAGEGEGGGERGESGGGVFEQRVPWEDPLATQPDRNIERSQINRGVGEVRVGSVPHIPSKLSRALNAHREKKFLQEFLNLESTVSKRAMVRFRGAREKSLMAFVECLGVSQEDTLEGPRGGRP